MRESPAGAGDMLHERKPAGPRAQGTRKEKAHRHSIWRAPRRGHRRQNVLELPLQNVLYNTWLSSELKGWGSNLRLATC